MAEALWLVTKTVRTGSSDVRDGIHAVIINADDGQNAAATIVEVEDRINAGFPSDSGAGDKIPAGYFDTAIIIDDLTSGPLKDDKDCFVFQAKEVITIESTA